MVELRGGRRNPRRTLQDSGDSRNTFAAVQSDGGKRPRTLARNVNIGTWLLTAGKHSCDIHDKLVWGDVASNGLRPPYESITQLSMVEAKASVRRLMEGKTQERVRLLRETQLLQGIAVGGASW